MKRKSSKRTCYEVQHSIKEYLLDEMSVEMQERLKRGAKLLKGLSQYKYSPLSQEEIIQKFKDIYGE